MVVAAAAADQLTADRKVRRRIAVGTHSSSGRRRRLPEGRILDKAAVALGDESFATTWRHLADNVVVNDAGLAASDHEALEDQVGRRNVQAETSNLIYLDGNKHLQVN